MRKETPVTRSSLVPILGTIALILFSANFATALYRHLTDEAHRFFCTRMQAVAYDDDLNSRIDVQRVERWHPGLEDELRRAERAMMHAERLMRRDMERAQRDMERAERDLERSLRELEHTEHRITLRDKLQALRETWHSREDAWKCREKQETTSISFPHGDEKQALRLRIH